MPPFNQCAPLLALPHTQPPKIDSLHQLMNLLKLSRLTELYDQLVQDPNIDDMTSKILKALLQTLDNHAILLISSPIDTVDQRPNNNLLYGTLAKLHDLKEFTRATLHEIIKNITAYFQGTPLHSHYCTVTSEFMDLKNQSAPTPAEEAYDGCDHEVEDIFKNNEETDNIFGACWSPIP